MQAIGTGLVRSRVQRPSRSPEATATRSPLSQRLTKKPDATSGHKPPGTAQCNRATWTILDHANSDTNEVQQPRCHHEAHAIADRIGGRRQFFTMSITVEDRENGHDNAGCPGRQPHTAQNQAAEHKHGKCNAEFDWRDRYAGNAQHATDRHDAGKYHRQHGDQRPTEDSAPETDRYHCQHMVGARKRVCETGCEATLQPGTRMCGAR